MTKKACRARIRNFSWPNRMEESAQAAGAELLWCLGFVWDAAEARRLREKHRLVGDAVGCVAGGALMNMLFKCRREQDLPCLWNLAASRPCFLRHGCQVAQATRSRCRCQAYRWCCRARS